MITYTIYQMSTHVNQINGKCDLRSMLTHHQQRPLQPIRLPIPQEIPHHQNSQHNQHNHKNLEIQIHWFTQYPTHDDDQRTIEERRLDGWTEAVEEGNVDDAVVGFVDGCEVFGCFFDERKEDKTEELIGDAAVDDGFDLFDEVD